MISRFNADPLPNRIIRMPEVIDRTGLSKAQVYKLIKTHKFPQQVRLGTSTTVGWPEHEVDEWVRQRIEERDLGARGKRKRKSLDEARV